jgi:hypothetical protein
MLTKFDSHHYNPLFCPQTSFDIDENRSYIHERHWQHGTYFLSIGLLADWTISDEGSFFYIAPEQSIWPRTIGLFGAILGSRVLHVDTEKGGVTFGTEHSSRMFADYNYGEGSALKFKSVLESFEHGKRPHKTHTVDPLDLQSRIVVRNIK